ncbi:MAG: PIN domain-containing protein [Oryzomonas sp.]|uniref:type II toxin-antitoxin system VapC family toxin n=1 Tax=Oryzomonas sp. TaxID=2855186 RepID=UPI002847A2B5|nr:PIN domain-containing protein [Oryzomonas sp.]MDR3579444.1 PIN domain-containing protein [Oryzomonas sp.]
MIIFLDANIIIYQVEAIPAFREKVRFVVTEIFDAHPGSRFAVSRLSLLECLVKPVRERNIPLIERYRSFFSASDLAIVEITPQVIERALLIRSDTGLRTPDAIQAASALILSDRTTFVTGDVGFARVSDLFSRIIS